MLKSYTVPRSPLGRAAIDPPRPWHCSSDLLAIELWADPKATASMLPQGLSLDPQSNGHACAMLLDWQFTAGHDEYLDPARYQYRGLCIHRCRLESATRDALSICLRGQQRRAGARLEPGVSQENRQHLPDAHRRSQPGGCSSRRRRTLRWPESRGPSSRTPRVCTQPCAQHSSMTAGAGRRERGPGTPHAARDDIRQGASLRCVHAQGGAGWPRRAVYRSGKSQPSTLIRRDLK
jgi:hypothetical protein